MLTSWATIKSFFAISARPESRPGQSSPLTHAITIVALIASEEDRRLLAGICQVHGWQVHFARACGDAAEAARRSHAPVILCDRDLPGTYWRNAVQILAASSLGVCVILVSSVLDDYLRSEVGRKGGYDILAKPLREDDVVRAVKLAWSYWNSTAAPGVR